MGKIRDTSHWTPEYRQARAAAAKAGRATWDEARLLQLRKDALQAARWILLHGYTSAPVLRLLVGRSVRFITTLRALGWVSAEPRYVRSAKRSKRDGRQVRSVSLLFLTSKGYREVIEEFALSPEEYPRTNRIDRPEVIRHNILAQLVAASLVRDLRSHAVWCDSYPPSKLSLIDRPDVRSLLRLQLRKNQLIPDELILSDHLDYSVFELEEFSLYRKIGYAIEVERTPKSEEEVKKLVEKLIELNRLLRVVLVTETSQKMESMLVKLEGWESEGVQFHRSMVTQLVVREIWDDPDPF